MALPELIVRKKSNTKPEATEDSIQPKEGQGGTETVIGHLPGSHTGEINQPHPSAISGRQEVSHKGDEGIESDQTSFEVPKGLYRMAFDPPPVESQSPVENIVTTSQESADVGSNPPISPETFLSGIGNNPEATPPQSEQAAASESSHDHPPPTPGIPHEIPVELGHTHFPESGSGQPEPAAAAPDRATKKHGTDSAQLLADMQQERERAQEALLGEQ